MGKFPGSIKVKITHPKLPDWYATSLMIGKTPEGTVMKLNALAARQGTGASYTLATEKEYWDYRARAKAQVAA